jgi:hypothetical protein
MRYAALAFACLLLPAPALFAADQPATAEIPLHRRIDRLLAAAEVGVPVAGPATDAEFLRRAYLDFVGVIPSTDEARAFLDDASPDKRHRLIDRLLDDPRHIRRLVEAFDVMFIERRSGNHVAEAEWRGWLRERLAANTPLDELAREMLTADGTDPMTRPAAKFLLVRNLERELVVRDLGRIFLGRDMECAQCHDHPAFPDFKQQHYYGLAAFVSRSYIFTDPKLKKGVIGEKAEGDVTFASVFTGEKGQTAPRMLNLPELAEPKPEKDPYVTKPTKTVRGVPKHSRRLLLAGAMTDPANAAFRQNFANRIWAMLLGRGLVHPLDLWHEANPPTHPQLMAALADELHASGYDLRHMLCEIALSEVYQRSSVIPDGVDPAELRPLAVAELRALSPEQFAWSVLRATGITEETLQAAISAAKKKPKDATDATFADPDWQEEALRKGLASQVAAVVRLFATGPADGRFDASADQALFLMNASTVQSWLSPRPTNLVGRAIALEDPAAQTEEIYLGVLSRRPTAEEQRQVAEYLASCGEDRTAAVQELTWALLTSAEFRLNH